MITFPRFEQQLAAKQLQKGKFYFEEELVCNLAEALPGYWKADVSGKNDYEVQITIQHGEITQTYCDCPHEVEFCKHVVAALYAIKAELKSRGNGEVPAPPASEAEFARCISAMPESELRAFVADYAKTNPQFRSLVLSRLSAQ
jgi:hypothetical protein